MAQKQAPVQITGTVVKSERRNGTFADRETGAPIAFDFIVGKVITEAFDSVEVRFPSDGVSVALPKRDEFVRLDLEARVTGGDLRLTATGVEVLGPSPLAV